MEICSAGFQILGDTKDLTVGNKERGDSPRKEQDTLHVISSNTVPLRYNR